MHIIHKWVVLETYSSSITDQDGNTYYGDIHTVEFICHQCGKKKKTYAQELNSGGSNNG